MCCLTNYNQSQDNILKILGSKSSNTSGMNYMCSDVYICISNKSIPDLHGSCLSLLGGSIIVTKDYGVTSLLCDY